MTQIESADTFIASLGIEAYRVGGSVRDEVLGRKAKDADYMVRNVDLFDLGLKLHATGAKISALKLRDGRQAGWRAAKPGMGLVEIVLPRKEVSTGPGHRDFEIMLDPALTIEDDAQRRDFTFNALYKIVFHPEGLSTLSAQPDGTLLHSVLDPTGYGIDDLRHKRIRTTHGDSFRDDPLRTLRALRFVSTLGYDLHPWTAVQMTTHAEAVTGLTAKGYASGTVLEEMSKLLMGESVATALRIARDTGVLGQIFPELVPMFGHESGSRYHDLTTDEHTFKALETAAHVDAPLRVRWALLFHDSGKPETEWVGTDGRSHYYSAKVTGNHPETWENYEYVTEDHEVASERLWRSAAKRLSVPARLREDVALLVREHMVPIGGKLKASKVRQGRVKYGDAMLRDLYLHRACDTSGKVRGAAAALERLRRMEQIRAQAAADSIPAAPSDLRIDGYDVKEFGFSGQDIGRVLRAVLHDVVSQPNERTLSREWQLERAQSA